MNLMLEIMANLVEKETFISVPGFKGYSHRDLAELAALGIAPIMGGDGTDDWVAVRAALGIAEDADPVAAIAGLRTEVASLKATIASDAPTAEKAAVAKLQTDLAEAQRRLVTLEAETSMKIVRLEQERNDGRAVALVEGAIAKGRAYPVQRDMLINMAKRDLKGTEEFMATLPSVDMRERGVASGNELAELEPTQADISVAKTMGIDTASKDWRLGIMREKAKAKGLTLPAEVA